MTFGLQLPMVLVLVRISLKNKAAKLFQIGLSCDDIMRRCIVKIFNDDKLKELYSDNDSKKILEYFTDLNFR